MTIVNGVIRNRQNQSIGDANVLFINKETDKVFFMETKFDGSFTHDIPKGKYSYHVIMEGYKDEQGDITIPDQRDAFEPDLPEIEEKSGDGSVPSIPTGEDIVDKLKNRLAEDRFSIEPGISMNEANQAVDLFSIGSLMLAGLGTRTVGSEEKTDIMGMLNLFYGMQDKSLSSRLVLQDSDMLWNYIELSLEELVRKIDELQGDVDFLSRETKRQFNLGATNSVLANTRFPTLFNRFVDVGNSPLLSIDVIKESDNQFFDKAKLQEVYDLMREMKSIALKIVRSLSKYGTSATRRINKKWADFEWKSLDVLDIVARNRVSEDEDEKTPWEVLAVLTDRNRDDIVPYIALSKHGAKLLKIALTIYKKSIKSGLDDYNEKTLADLFQAGDDSTKYLTAEIKNTASFIKRYPLSDWV